MTADENSGGTDAPEHEPSPARATPGTLSDKLKGRLSRNKSRYSWWRAETGLAAAAIAVGLLSATVSSSSRRTYQERLEQMYATETVIVAADELKSGTVLTRKHLAPARGLKSTLSRNAVRPDGMALVLDRRLAIDLKRGDVVYLSAVQGGSDVDKLSETIPPGKRLFTLPVSHRNLAYGWVRPNDHVDILANMELPGRGQVTVTVMQDVTLVSVGSASILSDEGKVAGGDISFIVTPEEYEILTFAEKRAQFAVSLRNPKDMERRNAGRGIDINGFLDSRQISRASGGGALEVIEEDGDDKPSPGPKRAKP